LVTKSRKYDYLRDSISLGTHSRARPEAVLILKYIERYSGITSIWTGRSCGIT
jgi:hypothetical protein